MRIIKSIYHLTENDDLRVPLFAKVPRPDGVRPLNMDLLCQLEPYGGIYLSCGMIMANWACDRLLERVLLLS
jgi:hypothetical protein